MDAVDGKVVHIPPGFSEIPLLIKGLLHFCNNQEDTPLVHPIIKGCIIHFMIGFIHPFTDGNGRTARTDLTGLGQLGYLELIEKDFAGVKISRTC